MSSSVITAFITALAAAGAPAVMYFAVVELPAMVRDFFARR
jgi:hypothetical protein